MGALNNHTQREKERGGEKERMKRKEEYMYLVERKEVR